MSEAMAFPQPFGRYQLVERMAVGGMAEIFRARVMGAHGFSKTVVIKRILPHLASDPSFVSMFIDEAKLTARLEHPKIIQVLDFGEADNQLFIAMEMVDGLDALGVLRACTHKKIRLPFALSVHVIAEVLDALDYAHKALDDNGHPLGIVHRDISPSNVLIARRGDVKLGDFGIARAAERQGKTKAGTLKGKYGYMSPEQVVGGDLDGRSDIFSCAIVLAEMLMGRRLFTAPNELDVLLMVRDVKLERLEKFGVDIPRDLRAILDRAFERDRDSRFATAGEFRDELAEWLFATRQRVGAPDLAAFVSQISDQAPQPEVRAPTSVEPPGQPGQVAGPIPGVAANRPSGMFSKAATGAAVRTPGASLLPPREGNAPSAPSQLLPPRGPSPFVGPTPTGVAPRPTSLGLPAGVSPVTPGSTPAAPQLASPRLAPAAPQAGAPSAAGTPSAPAPQLPPARSGPPPIGVRQPPAPRPSWPGSTPEPVATPPGASAAAEAERRRAPGSELPVFVDDSNLLPPDLALPHLGSPRPGTMDLVIEIESGEGGRPEMVLELPSGPLDLPMMSPDSASDAFNPVPDPPRPGPDAKPHAVPAQPDMLTPDRAPDEQGDLAQTSAIRLLARRAVAQETGLLVVDCNAIVKQIFLVRGAPEFVSSNVARELFGEYLKQHNVISETELAMALAMMPHFGGKLGDTLVGLGLLRPLEVFRHLTRQVREKLIDICTWQRGNYRWFAGVVNPRESFPLGLDAFEVMGAGSTALDAQVCADWVVPRANRRPAVVPGRARISPDQFRLGPAPRDLLNKLGGRKSIRELIGRYDREDDKMAFLRTLILLIETELVTLL